MEQLRTQRALEDAVECRVYPPLLEGDVQEQLADWSEKCFRFIEEQTAGYLWYHEGLTLTVSPPYVLARAVVRDGIEDEWYTVHVMYQLTRRHPGLVVSVSDGDGQFLLIEAAQHLPPWLKPETSDNRVFVYRGSLHIIPMPTSPAHVTCYPAATPTLDQALSLVRSDAVDTTAITPVQEAIQCRISRCNSCQTHLAHCYLPAKVAMVFCHDNQLVSAAVHALCDRDPIDMRACRKMAVFKPVDCHMTTVTFTRRLYAQLLREQFQPPRNVGFDFHGNSKPHNLGSKLTCGLEMLLSVSMETVGPEIYSGSKWLRFLGSLEENGYFKGELEGSRLHQQLVDKAKQFYANLTGEDNRSHRLVQACRAQHIVSCSHDPTGGGDQLPPEDDDSWLEVTPAQVDHMIQEAQGIQAGLDAVVDGMTSFVEGVSSHEGVELPQRSGEAIQLDHDQLLNYLQKGAGLLSDDNDDLSDDSAASSDEGEGVIM